MARARHPRAQCEQLQESAGKPSVRAAGRGRPGDRSRDPIAQKLVDAKVAGVGGALQFRREIPASKVYSDAGIPELSVSTNVKYTQQGFRPRIA